MLRSRVARTTIYVVGLVALFIAALAAWYCAAMSLVVQAPGESKSRFILRQLNYHARETKDIDLQEKLAKQLESPSADAIGVLIDEVAEGRGTEWGCRFSPKPVEILRRIGSPARDAVLQEMRLTYDRAEGNWRDRWLYLCYAYVYVSQDLSIMSEWCEANTR